MYIVIAVLIIDNLRLRRVLDKVSKKLDEILKSAMDRQKEINNL